MRSRKQDYLSSMTMPRASTRARTNDLTLSRAASRYGERQNVVRHHHQSSNSISVERHEIVSKPKIPQARSWILHQHRDRFCDSWVFLLTAKSAATSRSTILFKSKATSKRTTQATSGNRKYQDWTALSATGVTVSHAPQTLV